MIEEALVSFHQDKMSFQMEDYSDQLQRIKSNEEAINAVLGENDDGSSSPSGGQSSCKESEKSQQTSPGSTVDSFYTCCTSQEAYNLLIFVHCFNF